MRGKRSQPSLVMSKAKRPRPGPESVGSRESDARDHGTVTDKRFASLHWDPRFSRVPKREQKVVVDERFQDALKQNKAFSGSNAKVDMFGRATGVKGVRNGKDSTLERVFHFEEENSEGSSDGSDNEEMSDDEICPQGSRQHNAPSGEGAEVDDESEVESEYDSDDEEAETDTIARGDSTRRLAVMGLDWSKTRAVDLFATLQSFCPPEKVLKEVKVHPSKFGLERMKVEAKLGPAILREFGHDGPNGQDLELGNGALKSIDDDSERTGDRDYDNKGGSTRNEDRHAKPDRGDTSDGGSRDGGGNVSGDGSGHDSDDGSVSADNDDSEDNSVAGDHGENEWGSLVDRRADLGEYGTAVDAEVEKQDEQEKMRKYEEERLKYFYAVAEFGDVAAADAVYDQCDGVEFESSGLAMDLRFVPDEMKIEAPARDSASCVPDGYTPPNLAPSTLNNCKVKLSWDADAPDRAILKKRAFGKHEEDEANLKAYLASASESEEEGEGDGNRKDAAKDQKDIESKRALLLGLSGENVASDEEHAWKDEDMEMEVTFEPGLTEKGEEIVKRKEERETRADETHWDTRLRRMQEKKAEKRRTRKASAKSMGNGTSVEGSTNAPSASESDHDGTHIANGSSAFDRDPFFSMAPSREAGGFLGDGADRGPGIGQGGRSGSKNKAPARGKVAVNVRGTEQEDPEDAQRRARLELIMMEDDRKKKSHETGHRDRIREVDSDNESKDALKREKRKRTRGRRRRAQEASFASHPEPGANSAMDLSDERFSGLFSSHMFAMDPTHPKFKRNATTELILKEKSRRGARATETSVGSPRATPSQGDAAWKSGGRSRSGAAEVNAGTRPASDHKQVQQTDLMKLAASVKAKSSSRRRSDKK